MHRLTPTMAEHVAQAATAYQHQRTGAAPGIATAVLSGDTLVITLQGALSEAERLLSRDPAGAARVQEFHRELFGISAAPLRKEIERITGLVVRDAAGEVEPTCGAVAHAFASGTIVQVFQLAPSSSSGIDPSLGQTDVEPKNRSRPQLPGNGPFPFKPSPTPAGS